MKKVKIFGLTWMGVVLLSVQAFGATVNGIGFKVESGQSLVNIDMSGPAKVDSRYEPKSQQFILDITGSRLGPGAKRALNASSFDSPVTLVSPYQVNPDRVRVVVQLKKKVEGSVRNVGDTINVSFGAAPTNPGDELAVEDNDGEGNSGEDELDDDLDFEEEDDGEEEIASSNNPEPSAVEKATTAEGPKPPKDEMDQFLEARETRNFKGAPITLKVKAADVQDVLRLIAETSGFNIVVGKGVSGKVTLTLEEVPWDQALDVVLQTLNLGAERNNNVLRVLTLVNLTAEKRGGIGR